MIGTYKEKMGNIVKSGLQGEFDVIAHGCNCFCNKHPTYFDKENKPRCKKCNKRSWLAR